MNKEEFDNIIEEAKEAKLLLEYNNNDRYNTLKTNMRLMYAHLLKYQLINHKCSSWRRTILEQSGQMKEYKTVVWNKLTDIDISKTKLSGIDDFMKDNPKFDRSKVNYNIIDTYFVNPIDFTNNIIINKFLKDFEER